MSIFSDENQVKSVYFKFAKVGDKLEGTYVGHRMVPNRLKAGQDQNVYTIKKTDGEIIDVYGKPGIDAQMKRVKLGQIVGFEFKEERKATVPGYSPTHIIQVYANPTVVDTAWLKENEQDEASVPPTQDTSSANLSVEQSLLEINNLAVEKLGATTPEDIKNKVMEATGLAFIESNISQILEAMRQIPVK